MATCGILGQALGTAASMAVKGGTDMRGVDVKELQKLLMADDCFIPYIDRQASDLTKKASVNCELVRNGKDRGDDNCWIGKEGDYLEYTFENAEYVPGVRIVFDSFLNRNYHNMPCYYPLVQDKFQLPDTIIKKFAIEITDEKGETETLLIEDNRQRFVRIAIDKKITSIRLIPIETWGCSDMRVLSFEFID